MAGARTLVTRFTGSSTDLERATGRAGKAIAGVGDEAERTGSRGSRAIGALSKLGPVAVAAGGAAAVGIGAGVVAVGALGAAALKAGAETDEAVDTIRAGTGATGKQLDDLTASFKAVAGDVPASFGAVGTAVADLNTRLGLTGKPLEDVTKQVLQLEQVTGQKTNINDLSAALEGFNVPGRDASKTLDAIFRTSQQTGVPVNKLTAVLGKQGATLKSLGFSLTESADLYGTLDKAGINASAVTRSLGAGLVKLTKDGEKPAAAFKRVTGEISGFVAKGDEAGALQLASKVFGTKGAPQFVAALKSGKVNLDDVSKAATGSKDTIAAVARETEDFPEKWARFKNSALLALEPLGTALFGAIGKPLDKIGAWVEDHGDDIARVGDTAAAAFTTFGTVASAAIGPFISGITSGKDAFTGFATYVSTHQEDITRAIITGASAALTFGEGLGKMAALGLRAFSFLATGVAVTGATILDQFSGMLDAGEKAARALGLDGVADKLATARDGVNRFSSGFVEKAGQAARGAEALADTIDTKVVKAAADARKNLDRVGQAELGKARLRDAAAAVATSVAAIGTKADGSSVKLKRWSDRSSLSAGQQKALKARIDDARGALRSQVGALDSAGAGQKRMSAAVETGRKKLYAEFRQMGLSKSEAKKLSTQYSRVKSKVSTKIETPGMSSARGNARNYKGELDKLPKSKSTTASVTFSTNASGVVANLNKQFQLVKGGPKMTLATGGFVGVVKRAVGGMIPGRGGPRQDNILGVDRKSKIQTAWVSAKEFVINARETARRRRLIEKINAGRPDRELAAELGAEHGLPHRALGGPIGRVDSAHTRAHGRSATNGAQMLAFGAAAQMRKLIAATKKATQATGTFGKIDVSKPRQLTSFRGHTFSNLFAATLRAAEVQAKRSFSIFQGGWRPATSYSGTSHAGDAIDHQVDYTLLRAARAKGIADWDRTGKGNWVPHMHGVPRPGAGYAGGSGVWQAQDYARGGDGLRNGGLVRLTPRLNDSGSIIPRGDTLVRNHTASPEVLLPKRLVDGLQGGSTTINVYVNGTVVDGDRAGRQVVGYLEGFARRRGGTVVARRTSGAAA